MKRAPPWVRAGYVSAAMFKCVCASWRFVGPCGLSRVVNATLISGRCPRSSPKVHVLTRFHHVSHPSIGLPGRNEAVPRLRSRGAHTEPLKHHLIAVALPDAVLVQTPRQLLPALLGLGAAGHQGEAERPVQPQWDSRLRSSGSSGRRRKGLPQGVNEPLASRAQRLLGPCCSGGLRGGQIGACGVTWPIGV